MGRKKKGKKNFYQDMAIIIFCVSGAAISLNMFRADLFRTINSQSKTSIGSISIKHNTVQRRQEGRVIWERLLNKSPVYAGDLVGTADHSDAVINIEGRQIILDENTIIRIQVAHGDTEIDLQRGEISFNGEPDARIAVSINGKKTAIGPGRVRYTDEKIDPENLPPPVKRYFGNDEGEQDIWNVLTDSLASINSGRMEAPALASPQAGDTLNGAAGRKDHYFSWAANSEAESYTIQISDSPYMYTPVIDQTVRDNFYVYDNRQNKLKPGQYYWNVYFTDKEGGDSPHSDARSFFITEEEPHLRRMFPPDDYTIEIALLADFIFRWKTNISFERELKDSQRQRFQVSKYIDFSVLEIDKQVSGNSLSGCFLPSGAWYWRIFAGEGLSTDAGRFNVEGPLPAPVLEYPQPGAQLPLGTAHPVEFIWDAVGEAENYHFKLYAGENQYEPIYEAYFTHHTRQSVFMDAGGDYYWTVQALASESPRSTRRGGILGTGRFTLKKLPSLALESPANGTAIPGLAALRGPVVFRWSAPQEVQRSRFALSRSADPLQGRPFLEIDNPDGAVSASRIGEGVWYWTVEAWTTDGARLAAESPGQLRVLAIPLLPEPANRSPHGGAPHGGAPHGYRIEAQQMREIRRQGALVFSWQAVSGANAYIVTVFQETNNVRRQIIRSGAINQTRWRLSDLSLLDRGNFIWQVEAVNIGRDGIIEQRGRIADNTFVVDIPVPRIETHDAEILDDE